MRMHVLDALFPVQDFDGATVSTAFGVSSFAFSAPASVVTAAPEVRGELR